MNTSSSPGPQQQNGRDKSLLETGRAVPLIAPLLVVAFHRIEPQIAGSRPGPRHLPTSIPDNYQAADPSGHEAALTTSSSRLNLFLPVISTHPPAS